MTTDCYYTHHGEATERFACFDGKNTVCPRCCLEFCRAAHPDWFARCREAGHPTWPAAVHELAAKQPVANVPLGGPAPRKIVCLETYWDDHDARLFGNTSVRLFLEALAAQADPPLRLAHRFVGVLAQMSNYTARPDGMFWRDAESFDTPVFYLSFHGEEGGVYSALENFGASVLCEAFAGWGSRAPNLVYFGACSVFAGDTGQRFARDFLRTSGTRAVIGYTTEVDWMESMMTDLLFFRRFFRHPDPWNHLRAIHESVLADFAPARRLGYELHMPETPNDAGAQ